ncbi:MAG: hypothetical protein B7Y39_01360 [Bdellovibrio sp. 28-41-41]|nr:MAG: hypothetical protein B7Y39_01360 [Bdellovibrio sp. 28-41-41]
MKKIIFLSFILSSLAFAGGSWSSGGGGLLKDSRNPWFLNNISTVRYCIQIDEKNFGVSAEFADTQIQKSIAYWKKQFSFSITPTLTDFGPLKIATQTFNLVRCDDKLLDIKFQFGVLDNEQFRYLQKPNDFGAVSVRTDYVPSTMSAKGFIYVSPTQGSLAFRGVGKKQDIWKQNEGALLYLTLVHEMGHVFGLPHMGKLGDIMSESYVEMILQAPEDANNLTGISSFFYELPDRMETLCLKNFMVQGRSFDMQTMLDNWRKFFDLNQTDSCLKIIFEHQAQQGFKNTKVIFYFGSSAATLREVGYADVAVQGFAPVNYYLIWLPEGQTVFSKNDIQFNLPGIPGAALYSYTKTGTYESKSPLPKRSLIVQFTQGSGSISITGIVDNEIITIR